MRLQVLLVLIVSACSTTEPSATSSGGLPGGPAGESVRDVWEEAARYHSEREEEPFAPPTARALETHAIRLAELADRAAEARVDHDDDPLIRRLLARRADTRRDVLLGCRPHMWNVAPSQAAHPVNRLQVVLEHDGWSDQRRHDALRAMPAYVQAVQSRLREGRDQGLVASRAAIELSIRAVDARLETSAPPRPLDGQPDPLQLWAFPALRHYRTLLEQELLPNASDPGLTSLPGGDRCYRALLARHLGPSWTPDRVRGTALRWLNSTAAAKDAPPAAPDASAPLRPPNGSTFAAPWFETVHSEASVRGWRLYRGRTNLRRAAATARADVGLHRDRWGVEESLEFLKESGGFSDSRAQAALREIVVRPGVGAAALAGFVDIRRLRRDRGQLTETEFENRLRRFGPLPLDLVATSRSF